MRQSYLKQNNLIEKIILFITLFLLINNNNQLFSMESTEAEYLQNIADDNISENTMEENPSEQFNKRCDEIYDTTLSYLLDEKKSVEINAEKYLRFETFWEMVGKCKKLIDEYKFNVIMSRDSSDIYEQLKEECKEITAEDKLVMSVIIPEIGLIIFKIITNLVNPTFYFDSSINLELGKKFLQYEKKYIKKNTENPDISNILIKISNIIEKINPLNPLIRDPSNPLINLLRKKNIKKTEDLEQFEFKILEYLFVLFVDLESLSKNINTINFYGNNNQILNNNPIFDNNVYCINYKDFRYSFISSFRWIMQNYYNKLSIKLNRIPLYLCEPGLIKQYNDRIISKKEEKNLINKWNNQWISVERKKELIKEYKDTIKRYKENIRKLEKTGNLIKKYNEQIICVKREWQTIIDYVSTHKFSDSTITIYKKKSIQKLLIKNKKKKITGQNEYIQKCLLENNEYSKDIKDSVKRSINYLSEEVQKKIEKKIENEWKDKINKELNKEYDEVLIKELLEKLVISNETKIELENFENLKKWTENEIIEISKGEHKNYKKEDFNYNENEENKKRYCEAMALEIKSQQEKLRMVQKEIDTIQSNIKKDKKNKKEELLDKIMKDEKEKKISDEKKKIDANMQKMDKMLQGLDAMSPIKKEYSDENILKIIKEILEINDGFLNVGKIKELKERLEYIKNKTDNIKNLKLKISETNKELINKQIVENKNIAENMAKDLVIELREIIIISKLSKENERNKILIEKLKQELIDKKIMSESELENIEKDIDEKKTKELEEIINKIVNNAKTNRCKIRNTDEFMPDTNSLYPLFCKFIESIRNLEKIKKFILKDEKKFNDFKNKFANL